MKSWRNSDRLSRMHQTQSINTIKIVMQLPLLQMQDGNVKQMLLLSATNFIFQCLQKPNQMVPLLKFRQSRETEFQCTNLQHRFDPVEQNQMAKPVQLHFKPNISILVGILNKCQPSCTTGSSSLQLCLLTESILL